MIDRFRSLAEDVDRKTVGDEPFWEFLFPAAADAEYRFSAFVYDDGAVGITASRKGAEKREYFWNIAFEPSEFEAVEELDKRAASTVSTLLRHDSRIIQSVGLVNVGFDCEYLNGKAWHSVGGCAALRFSNFEFPRIQGQQRAYHASAAQTT